LLPNCHGGFHFSIDQILAPNFSISAGFTELSTGSTDEIYPFTYLGLRYAV
jgi:hypothetical protein